MKNKKAQFRIARTYRGFFPHVRFKKWIGWGRWYRIGKHPNETFGLYSELDGSYATTEIEAIEIINNYIQFERTMSFNVYR